MKEDLRQPRLNKYVRHCDGFPSNERRIYRSVGKPVFDMILAALLLLVCAPILLLLAALVWLDVGSPVFAHERVGRNGREFNCLKFRTMRRDSDRALQSLLLQDDHARREWRKNQKLMDDPRVTRLGGFLRRTSLDELPQLFNVLRGEMSLVGPRPITADEVGRYDAHFDKYMALRPGLTGLWQVYGRGRVSYEERVQMDAQYFASLTFGGDLSLILKTGLVVLRQQGQ